MNDLRPEMLVRFRELARRMCARQTTKVIARGMDKTPTTIRKYMRDESFLEILKEMDEEVWRLAMADMKSMAQQSIFARAEEDAGDAYGTLVDIMNNDKASDSVRSKNAETVLEIAGAKVPAGAGDMKVAPIHTAQLLVFKDTLVQVAKARNVTDDEQASGADELAPGPAHGQPN